MSVATYIPKHTVSQEYCIGLLSIFHVDADNGHAGRYSIGGFVDDFGNVVESYPGYFYHGE